MNVTNIFEPLCNICIDCGQDINEPDDIDLCLDCYAAREMETNYLRRQNV